MECKHYQQGAPPRSYSRCSGGLRRRTRACCFIASGFLSNPAKENLQKCEANRRPPFRIKHWERPILERLTGDLAC